LWNIGQFDDWTLLNRLLSTFIVGAGRLRLTYYWRLAA
jgi:hypothetical protein